MSLLGLDVGTTGTKAVAFNEEGAPIASAYREYPLLSPRPGWQELDPEAVWSAIREVLIEVAAKTASDPIRAIGISAQGEAVHAVDTDRRCISNSVVTFDARTADMPAWWLQHKSRTELALITGMPLHGMYSLNKILWFKQNQPDVYRSAWKWLCYEDFVHLRLGLEPVISLSLAARTMALDVRAGRWSEDVLGIAGVDPALLATPAPSGRVVGSIPHRVCEDLGLPKGVVVVTGGHDQPAGALGAGILSSGEAVYATGTVECICPIFSSYTVNSKTVENNLCCYPSCVPGLYASIAFNFTGGSLLRWYRDTLAQEEVRIARETGQNVYDVICRDISPDPENLLLLPHFTVTGTPHFDTQSRGALLGLTLNTPKDQIVAALLSGVTYEMKLNLEMLQSAGVVLRRLRAVGGGAKSRTWVQRKADILGMPVAVLETTEAAAFGVAMLAGRGVGVVPSIENVVNSAVKFAYVCEPDEARRRAFQERFEVYRDVYPALREINRRLAQIEK